MFVYPNVSVIIRVKNEGKTLEKVLTGIKGQDYPAEIELIVVDSGSTDNTCDIAHQHNCKLIRIQPEDFTFGKALNLGYQSACGEIFVNLSGHSIPVDNQFLKNLIAPYKDPVVMATFGRNVPGPDACPSEANDLEGWFPNEWLDVPDRFSNGNASLRRAMWEAIPFNEEVSGSEDILWAKKVLATGFQIAYVPTAPVYHSHSSSVTYAYTRRYRETKAMITHGQFLAMGFSDFIRWTIRQTRSDIRYAKQKRYSMRWYFHIPFYRIAQGFGIYRATPEMARGNERGNQTIKPHFGKLLGYYQKSIRVIKTEGWKSFASKGIGKITREIRKSNVSLGHQRGLMQMKPKIPTSRKYKVIFIVDPVGFLTNHYRAENMIEYLNIASIESEIILETELNYEKIATYDMVILCRVFMNPHIRKLIEMCRTLRIPVVFDVDDFVIDPSIVNNIAPIENLSDYEKSLHVEGMKKHRESFEAADFFTAPTDYLVDVGTKLAKPSFVIRNGLSRSQIECCKKIVDIKDKKARDIQTLRHDNIKIGYFSGTKTHQKDFSVAIPALLRIMKEFPHVHLYIGGYLDLDEKFDKFSDRVKKFPFVSFDRLPYNIAKVDITIVPLELKNPFCEAKSELKYFDAGLLKIPTVASPTNGYKWAIQNGVNGFLASSADEWYNCLKRLIEDHKLRRTMGQNAYEHVMKSYTPNAMASSVQEVYREIITRYREKIGIPESMLKISFVIPSPIKGSGGHNKIFTAAKCLSEFGHSVSLHFMNDGLFRGQGQLREFIFTHFFDPGCEIIFGMDLNFSVDVLCATSWMSAYAVNENKNRAAKLFYFVQDIESLFFSMGDDYLKAESTYRLGMHHISFGPWCAKILKERYNAKVDYIPFAIDKTIYYPRSVEKGETRKVLFFARPEMPRRCYKLGIEALTIFHKRNPDVKIVLFGSKWINSTSIPFPHKNLGVLPSNELPGLYSGVDVGIVFSTTNPSLVPFEMMACRCPVIDLDYNDNHINYGTKENVKLVGISPEEVASGIEEMIHNDDLRNQITENGFRFVNNFPDDRETFEIMESIFLKAFGIEKSTAYTVEEKLYE